MHCLEHINRAWRSSSADSSGSASCDASSRDRSKSVFVPSGSVRDRSEHDVSAFKLFHRRASSVLSHAAETISLRGIFSRLASLEHARASKDEEVRKFRKETPKSTIDLFEVQFNLENSDEDNCWYFKYFLGFPHQNFIGIDCNSQPFIISAVKSKENPTVFRLLLFQKSGQIKLEIDYKKSLSMNQLVHYFNNLGSIEKGLGEIQYPSIQKDLLLLEEQEGFVHYKIGVLYCQYGQTSDTQMLGNETGSEPFQQLLDILGDRVELKGFNRYRGGLDNKHNKTGKYAIFTSYMDHDIIFHVSTMLPHSKRDREQTKKKCHIGNDIVNIIFLDSMGYSFDNVLDSFKPSFIKTFVTHIFIVVTPASFHGYKVTVWIDESVADFGPSLPSPPVFKTKEALRCFILSKAINGEKATFRSPTFAARSEHTVEMILRDLYEEHIMDIKNSLIQRTYLSSRECQKVSKVEELARQVDFVRYGLHYKQEAAMQREESYSCISEEIKGLMFKKSEWELKCYHPSFIASEIYTSDTLNCEKLVIATNDGTYIVQQNVEKHRMVFDKTVRVFQLNIVEYSGLLILRIALENKKSECVVCSCKLSRLISENYKKMPYSRNDLFEDQIKETRGCHLYAINNIDSSRLRMVVAIKRKIIFYHWNRFNMHQSLTHQSEENNTENHDNTADGFIKVWELTLAEIPSRMAVVEGVVDATLKSFSETLVVAAMKNSWVIIDKNMKIRTFYESDEDCTMVDILELEKDGEIELGLCYNNLCHFQKAKQINEERSSDFRWDINPKNVVCCFPHLFVIDNTKIEVRHVINGLNICFIYSDNLKLLSSKSDLYFASTSPELPFTHWELIGPEGLKVYENFPSKTTQNHLRIFKLKTKSSSQDNKKDNSFLNTSYEIKSMSSSCSSVAKNSASKTSSNLDISEKKRK